MRRPKSSSVVNAVCKLLLPTAVLALFLTVPVCWAQERASEGGPPLKRTAWDALLEEGAAPELEAVSSSQRRVLNTLTPAEALEEGALESAQLFHPLDGGGAAASAPGPVVGSQELVFVPLDPCTLADTRLAGGPFGDGEIRFFAVHGETTDYSPQGGAAGGCGIPDLSATPPRSNIAKAVLLHLEVLSATGDGKVIAWPANQPQPISTHLSYPRAPFAPSPPTVGSSGVAVAPLCDEAGATPCASGDLRVRLTSGAQLVLSVHGYFRENPSVPPGLITLWSGLLADIPSGWALCDGSSGTPDLRDRFVLAPSAGEDPGALGGTHTLSLTVDQLPQHSHEIDIERARFHTHTYLRPLGRAYAGNLIGGPDSLRWDLRGIESASTSEEELRHRHDAEIFPAGRGMPVDNRPAFYKLAFIMKL